jgi:hypothetical protein
MKKNGYPIPDPNETMINVTSEPSDAHKKSLKEEIMEEIMCYIFLDVLIDFC